MRRAPVLRWPLGLAAALALLLARPVPAHACLWNIFHWFNPLPPCQVQDDPSRFRVQQTNLRILAKLGLIAEHVREVRAEIEGWKRAARTARAFQDQLVAAYGDLSANPLPSLVAEYNRTPMANWVALDSDGTYRVTAEPVNFRRAADSIWHTFQDTSSLVRLYRKTWALPEELPSQVYEAGAVLERQILALGDHEAFTRPILDSLHAVGERAALRYAGRADIQGLAEARISHLAITLSKLRGTAFEAQARGLSAKIQSLSAATEKRRQLEHVRTVSSQAVGF